MIVHHVVKDYRAGIKLFFVCRMLVLRKSRYRNDHEESNKGYEIISKNTQKLAHSGLISRFLNPSAKVSIKAPEKNVLKKFCRPVTISSAWRSWDTKSQFL